MAFGFDKFGSSVGVKEEVEGCERAVCVCFQRFDWRKTVNTLRLPFSLISFIFLNICEKQMQSERSHLLLMQLWFAAALNQVQI